MTSGVTELKPIKRLWLIPDYRNSVFEGYAIKYLERNAWKFQRTLGDWDDVVSEAAYCYYWARKFYSGKVFSASHFMSLFKRTLYSWFTDWSNYNTRFATTLELYTETAASSEVTTDGKGMLVVKLREASKELKQVLSLIANAPAEVCSTFKSDIKRGVDQFFPKAVTYCGIPASKAVVLESELRSLLTDAPKKVKAKAAKREKPVRWFDNNPPPLAKTKLKSLGATA